MAPLTSDAFVFFGATGDLAHKKIFPALQSMVKHGTLNVPVIGVSKSGWTLEQLRARAKDSVTQHGGRSTGAAFPKLCELMDYIDGDYNDDKTLHHPARQTGRREVAHALSGNSARIFSDVVEGLAKSGCARTCVSSSKSPSAAIWRRRKS